MWTFLNLNKSMSQEGFTVLKLIFIRVYIFLNGTYFSRLI